MKKHGFDTQAFHIIFSGLVAVLWFSFFNIITNQRNTIPLLGIAFILGCTLRYLLFKHREENEMNIKLEFAKVLIIISVLQWIIIFLLVVWAIRFN